MSRRPAKSEKHARRNAREAVRRAHAKRVDELRSRLARGDGPPLPERARMVLVAQAIDLLRAGKTGGKRSGANRLAEEDLFEIAWRVIGRGESAAIVAREFEREAAKAKIGPGVLTDWVASVKSRYRALQLSRVKDILAEEDAAKFSGDHRAMLDAVMSRATVLAIQVLPEFKEADWQTRNTIARVLGVVGNLAETLSKTGHQEVSTERMRLALDKAIAEARRSQGAGTITDLDQIAAVIRREAGLEPGKEAA